MPIIYYTRDGAGVETALPNTTRGNAPTLKKNLRLVTPPTGTASFAVGDGKDSNDSKVYTLEFYLSAATPAAFQVAREAMMTRLRNTVAIKVDWDGTVRYRDVLFVEVDAPKTRTGLGNSADFTARFYCKFALWSATFGGTANLASQ
jgi:hypothetical protein